MFNGVSTTERENLEALIMAFDTNLAPIVGQQVTLTNQSEADSLSRVELPIERAGAPFVIANEGTATECDLVVQGVVDAMPQSWLRRSDGSFESADGSISESELLALAEVPGQPLTFTCAPPGSGRAWQASTAGPAAQAEMAARVALAALPEKAERAVTEELAAAGPVVAAVASSARAPGNAHQGARRW